MSEQPASVLFEAVRLAEVLRRRLNGANTAPRDVWSDATADDWGEHVATGAAECRYCPVCRAIAASRASGPDVLAHVMTAGESLYAAVREAVAGFERTKPPRPADERADGDRRQA
jgi:hypothetical protein